MEFFVPLTTSRDHLHDLIKRLNPDEHSEHFPFNRIIVSPLFCRNSVLDFVKRHRDKCRIIFDSGGFYVQQGRISFFDLFQDLECFYRKNHWADYYVLPDNPPTPKDPYKVARSKGRQTVEQSAKLYASMPKSLQLKAIGVIHAISEKQLDCLVDEYSSLGLRYLAFGAFAMSGPSLAINSLTYSSLKVLVHLSRKTCDKNIRLHLFGVGNPALIAIFGTLGISSFDSSSWLRSAAFGNVYLPFLGAFSISGRTKSRRFRTRKEFEHMCQETAHLCSFCRDFDALRDNWMKRALHNLAVMNETVERFNNCNNFTEMFWLEKLLEKYNPQFLRYWAYARKMLA